jgi:Flp pilus assembly protein TadD
MPNISNESPLIGRAVDIASVSTMNFDAFISYPHRDKTTADAVCATLEAAGIRCWFAPRDVPAGAEWAAAIVDAIDHCCVMVLVFSASANRSKQIHREVQRAFDKEVPVIPFRIENVTPESSLAYYMGPVHWLDAMSPPLEQHLQHLSDAVSGLIKREKLGPVPAYWQSNASFDQACACVRDGEYDRAPEVFNEALRVRPKSEDALLDNSSIGEEYESLGKAYADKGEHDRAIEAFDEAIRLKMTLPTSAKFAPFRQRGTSYASKGEHDRAIKDFDEATRLDEKASYAFYRRGLSYANKGEYDRAIMDFDEAIRLDPLNSDAFYNRGLARRKINDDTGAEADIATAKSLPPRRR